jgi:hypothetical protein
MTRSRFVFSCSWLPSFSKQSFAPMSSTFSGMRSSRGAETPTAVKAPTTCPVP